MSYIAKIHLNKMFPKTGENALHIDGEWLVMPYFNVIYPIRADNPPKDVGTLMNSFEIIGDDSTAIAGKNNPTAPIRAVWHGKEYTPTNYISLKDNTIAMGDLVIFYLKNPGWKVGETHKITISIIMDHPIKFTIERTIEEKIK